MAFICTSFITKGGAHPQRPPIPTARPTTLSVPIPAQMPLDQLANPIHVTYEDNKFYLYSANDILYVHRVNRDDVSRKLVSQVSIWVDMVDDNDGMQSLHSETISIEVGK